PGPPTSLSCPFARHFKNSDLPDLDFFDLVRRNSLAACGIFVRDDLQGRELFGRVRDPGCFAVDDGSGVCEPPGARAVTFGIESQTVLEKAAHAWVAAQDV